ncbi:isochorismatase [Pseudoalteromonas sp. NBT06-2]|uniref:YybH family protein n=1 Tax=Pseudoalteromonas sp. NBT06-2 TaxID=2025950 RepID=UPI000BA6664A|nr:nuclear transport factor 2 family protein [Pseudoalteromonas sp. NBT06-2]PAJ72581.1 isochorismatase [Pseudoalteromonas sp. NBT06-2]
MAQQSVFEACKAGILKWQTAFNKQDAAGCAALYHPECTMVAKPFGTFTGTEQIQALWQNIIDQGFKQVEYNDVIWQPEGEDGYLLTSNWQMNKAFGVVHKEHWQVQPDGTAFLIYDEFEVLGEH